MMKAKKAITAICGLAIAAAMVVTPVTVNASVVEDAVAQLQAAQNAHNEAVAAQNRAAVEANNAAKVAAQKAAVEATKSAAEAEYGL